MSKTKKNENVVVSRKAINANIKQFYKNAKRAEKEARRNAQQGAHITATSHLFRAGQHMASAETLEMVLFLDRASKDAEKKK